MPHLSSPAALLATPMFRHKVFVTSDELDLSDDALRYIKTLNASIPAKNREIWVTIEEMVDRLVHCGALPFLKAEHVSHANQRFKSVAPLEQRRQQFGGERHIYFRPEEFTEGAPLDQRGVDGLRCPAYLPQRNYFRFKRRRGRQDDAGDVERRAAARGKCGESGHPTKDCPAVKSKRKKSDKMLIDWNVLQPPPEKAKEYEAKIKW